MRQRKHLGRLAVCAIEENQRRQVICQGETAKLIDVQFAVAVAAHDGTDHHQHAGIFSFGNHLAQGIRPCG